MKTWRNKATRLRRKAIKDYWNGVSGKLDKNPKKFFGTFMPFIISKCAKDKDSTDISLHIQGQLQQNKQIVEEEFTRYLSTTADNIEGMEASCLTEEKCYRHPRVSAIRHRQMPSTFNIRSISREEVLDALRGINPRKATGFDGLSPRMLKLVADEIAEPLTVVFNQVIQEREWPKEGKRGEWVPVYKKEDLQNIANYRPVILLPAVNKIFEQLICYQLRDKFENYL